MNINQNIFKAYDIRGIYPQDINEQAVQRIVASIYIFFQNKLKKSDLTIVLGRDMRISSPSLFEIAKKALLDQGATVIDVGLVSTPTFYFAVLNGMYDAGIQISASHNPKEYNGIKFVKRVGKTLIKIGKNTGMDEVKKLALSGQFENPKKVGKTISKTDAVIEEVDAAIKTVNPQHIKKFKIVADPANAMGALYLEELFKKLPCELIKMNFNLDGTFPSHQPDPLQFDTLKDLQKKVIEEKADLGIAPDGDGDRVFFINEKAAIINPTLITSLIASTILKNKPKEKIIVDIRYTQNVQNICNQYGSELLVSKVGHAFITELLNKEEAAFAGESSGHYYFRETGGAESSIRVILYLLEAMGKSGKPVSQLLEEFHNIFESGEYNFVLPETAVAKDLLEQISQGYKDGQISHLDGLAVDFPDWRFNIRTSNTEPLLRLNLEAKTEDLMRKKLNEILTKLQQTGAVRK